MKRTFLRASSAVAMAWMLCGCSGSIPLGTESEWKADAAWLAPSVKIGDFTIKPPLNYRYDESGASRGVYSWRDSQQPDTVQGMTPIAPKSSQMVPCITDVVQKKLEIDIQPTSRDNTQQNLADICKAKLSRITMPVGVKNFVESPIEFGTVRGLRFCKGAWSADILRQRRFAGASMSEPVPAQGIYFVTIANGYSVVADATVPKGDSGLKTMEQAVLSLEPIGASRVASSGSSAGGPPPVSPRQLFDKFKRLDLANDPRIIDMYASDAQINMFGVPYSRAGYAAFIAGSYKMAPNLNALTRYDEPVFSEETANSARVTFTARASGAAIDLEWKLRKNADGTWQIASEKPVLHR